MPVSCTTRSLQKALSYRISAKLCSNEMSMTILREIVDAAYENRPRHSSKPRAPT